MFQKIQMIPATEGRLGRISFQSHVSVTLGFWLYLRAAAEWIAKRIISEIIMIHYRKIQFQNAKEEKKKKRKKTVIHAKETRDCKRSHCITVTILPAICCQRLNGRLLSARTICDSDPCLWCLLNMIIATWVIRLPYSCHVVACIFISIHICAQYFIIFFPRVVKSRLKAQVKPASSQLFC